MTMFGSQWLANAGASYEIEQSIRFNDDDSAFLARTPDASNRKTWTWSAWVKRADLFNGSVPQILLSAGDGGANDFVMQFGQSDDTLRISDYISSTQSNLITTQLFRDVGAWYHFVLAYDTTQGTAANRIKLYVNGSQVTAFGTETYPSENQDLVINSAIAHNIGRGAYSSNGYFSGYMAEINFVDGTALAPTAFGETNDDGVWIPKAYSGAYGTEGYFIDGRDSSDLGDDESGNGNDYSSSGLTAADQMSDTPTLNFCTMNPLDAPTGSITLSNGNLDLNQSSFNKVRGTIAFDVQDDDGFYFEVKKTNGNFRSAGIVATDASNFASAQSLLSVNPSVVYYMEGGEVNQNGSLLLGSLATFSTNDVLGVAVRNGKVYFAKNNTYVNSGDPVNETGQVASITGSSPLYSPAVGEQNNQGGITNTVNFGATAFAHTPPTGYKALNTANLPTPAVKDGSEYFQPTIYTGTGSSRSVDQSGNSTFQPDWVWVKSRNAGYDHALYDAVRGVTKELKSNATSAEATISTGLTAFESDGFQVGSRIGVNGGSDTFVAWQWAANGSGSSNEDGSINSTATSANTTAGFSIVKFVGNGTSGATVGHGLGAVPKMLILKDLGVAENWCIYHEAIGPTKFLFFTADAAFTASNRWNNTAPTSSVFSLGNETQVNASGRNYIVYAFAEIPGYSSIGSFIGNGSTDGPFMFTGFKPAFIIFKNSGNANNWDMMDTQRSPINPVDQDLQPSTSSAESTPGNQIDYLSNGFKLRTTTANLNNNGNTIIYMAFAENPFGGDGAAPGTAR